MIQGSFGSSHGNFEVVVPVDGKRGRTYLRHVWHDNSDVHLPWRFGQTITEIVSTGGSGCLIESDYRSVSHGNFELLVDECQQTLSGYWHPNEDVNLPWLRNSVLLGEAPTGESRTLRTPRTARTVHFGIVFPRRSLVGIRGSVIREELVMGEVVSSSSALN